MGQTILITTLSQLPTLSLVVMCTLLYHYLYSPAFLNQLTFPILVVETPTFHFAHLSSSYGLVGLTELFHVPIVS